MYDGLVAPIFDGIATMSDCGGGGTWKARCPDHCCALLPILSVVRAVNMYVHEAMGTAVYDL